MTFQKDSMAKYVGFLSSIKQLPENSQLHVAVQHT